MQESQLKNLREPIPAKVEEVATITVDAAFKVHKELGPGLLESAYEICLAHELRKRGLSVKTQISMPIIYDNLKLEDVYRIDILVEDCLVVELKSIDAILPVHRSQLLTYLKFSGHRLGLLLNFNAGTIKEGTKRVVL